MQTRKQKPKKPTPIPETTRYQPPKEKANCETYTCHHQDCSEVLKCHVPSEPSLECAVLVLIPGLIPELAPLSDKALWL